MLQTFSPALQASITVNRNRLKSYGNTFYLKNGSNFELELFNPQSERYLVKIEIDGKLISSTGLVINPGQRVYLERWIDDARKFEFSTYDVDNSDEAKSAISKNGKVKISFHSEITKFTTNSQYYYYYPSTVTIWPPYYNQSVFTTTFPIVGSGGTSTVNCGTSAFYSNTANSSATLSFNASTTSNASCDLNLKPINTSANSIETGRTEQGEHSSQSFGETTGDFNSSASAVIEMQILPDSQMPVEFDKVRSYCSNCGTRKRAENWKFCPSCGEKI